MDPLFEKPEKRHLVELNVVPIIDLFTVVIFFLLLSTTFMALSKLTVPPTRVSTITDPVAPPPLAPKFLVMPSPEGDGITLSLKWAGNEPGYATEKVSREGTEERMIEAAQKLVRKFAEKYPDEKSVQLGLTANLTYQDLIAVMDGVRDKMPNVVLISYDEVRQ